MCHGTDAIGRSQTFNYAQHLTNNMRSNVKQMVEYSFNVTMIWDKLIHDVEYEVGPLFTGIARDALETRQDILNMYNDIKRQEYVKDQSDPTSVDCWYNQFLDKLFFYQQQDVMQNIPTILGIQTSWM